MSSERNLVIIGEAQLGAQAATIGVIERGAAHVRVFELAPDQIGATDLAFLSDDLPDSTDVFAAIGPAALNYARFDLWAMLKLRGYRCATLVHPRAHVDSSALLADNVLVGPNAAIEPGARIQRGSIVSAAASIGTRATIGAWAWIARAAVVGAGASVGEHVVLGSGVQLADHTDLPGPAEIDMPGVYRGRIASGTFVSPEFPAPGARKVQST